MSTNAELTATYAREHGHLISSGAEHSNREYSCRTQRYFLNVAVVMAMATPSITAHGRNTAMGLSEKGSDR